MKKPYIQFLLISFFISYAAFGGIIYSQTSFNDIFLNPQYLLILLIGCLGPFLSSFFVYNINRETMGGTKGFIDSLKTVNNPKSIYLVPLFFISHYAFLMILKNIHYVDKISGVFYYLPFAFMLLGLQEIGWRGILQPSLEKNKDFFKSTIATGLIWSLWFLPLVYIPGFFILPQYYLQFAIFLVGISFLLSTVYRVSGSIFYSILLSTLIFGFFPIIMIKQNYMLLALAILEAILSSLYKDKSTLSTL